MLLRSRNRGARDGLIKRRERPAVLHGQREEVGIRQLIVPQQKIEIEGSRIPQANVIRPECLVVRRADLHQLVANRSEPQGAGAAISRSIEHAHDAILHPRAGRDLQAATAKHGPGAIIEYMIIIEQGDPDIDIASQFQTPSSSISART